MEPHKSIKQDKPTSVIKEDKASMKNSEGDSSISITFDSAADCSYKSGEISTHITSSEQLSNLSLSDSGYQQSKTDQNLRFDSGLEADIISPSSESGYWSGKLPESSKPLLSPTSKLSEKLQWKDIFTQDKDGDT